MKSPTECDLYEVAYRLARVQSWLKVGVDDPDLREVCELQAADWWAVQYAIDGVGVLVGWMATRWAVLAIRKQMVCYQLACHAMTHFEERYKVHFRPTGRCLGPSFSREYPLVPVMPCKGQPLFAACALNERVTGLGRPI